jgi:excisionase family DNA binding protein
MNLFRPIEPAYFDLPGASSYTGGGLSVRTLRRLISQPGGLPHIRAGRGKILIKRADLDDWLEARRRKPVNLDALARKALKELEGGHGE